MRAHPFLLHCCLAALVAFQAVLIHHYSYMVTEYSELTGKLSAANRHLRHVISQLYLVCFEDTSTVLNTNRNNVMSLKGTQTEQNLLRAFASDAQCNRLYLYFAAKADVEGLNDVSAVFRSTAEGETGHAHGHLEYLEACGNPLTDRLPMGATRENLAAAIARETYEYTEMYPNMAKIAREEGFAEIADWFEVLAKAERAHANRFQKCAETLK